MNTTATAHYETAASLHNAGAIVATMDPKVPGKFLNYVATHDQDVSGGNVKLELAEESKRHVLAAQQNIKADKKLDTMKAAPAAKPNLPTLAERLQQRGMERQNTIASRLGRPQPNRYAALNALNAQPAPAAKPAVAPVVAIAPSVTMQVGQLKQREEEQANRAGLRLVASNDAPKPAAKTQALPMRPSGFARRHEKLCQGMGAYNFG